MRFNLILASVLSLASLALSSQVVLDDELNSDAAPAPETEVPVPTDPVVVTAGFPESNVFGHIINGEKNTIDLAVENKSGKNVTLLSVGGAIYNAETSQLIKNLTASNFKVPLPESVQLRVPFVFFSECVLRCFVGWPSAYSCILGSRRPGDIRLSIWLDHTLEVRPLSRPVPSLVLIPASSQDETVRIDAYDAVVTVVEPEVSLFDFKMITTYLMTAALLGGLGYVGYLQFGPKPRKTKKRVAAPADVSAPVGSVTATGAGGYQEEWIPEHHMRKPKTGRKKSGAGGLTSGDDMSASELSESAGKKSKGRK
ncbi:hypothetical protein HMN09_00312900 [Mycena chlorophos]|uniref:Translocon-associated protein subunit alpha n=1 Tax=Mycena chlorophos TaxID=658473 RepID=A0A8H6TJX0_MYCCL|nr:hypothetical protein HMN09_00312900 [Mycena chlorophos]